MYMASSATITASQLAGFSAVNLRRNRPFLSPNLRPHSWIVASRLEGGSVSVGNFPSLSLVSDRRRIRVGASESSYTSVEKEEESEDSAANSVATEPKKSAKIHDFCFGIPFGGLIFSGGVIGFLFSRNPLTLGVGVLYGGALLALSTFSLKIWRQGKSCFPYILGQGALAAILLWKNFQTYSLTKKLFPSGFFAAICAAMLCFYSYVLLSGGNPPPKKLKASPSIAS